ncbi:TIGR01777 family oxidoreductase [Flammeovirgaceae bacterium SG7u.111]|nr:TIGR01777 family oxidoreductase [Flammeovirgaceae bacterium SG7u.132]WPO35683.1 TIGR01777 family oxidoreductase [Flammeovirgaceae bacterium SG7u.111]
MSQKILITGGTGLVGQALTKLLLQHNYEVSYLSRQKNGKTKNIKHYQWNIKKGFLEEEAIREADYIIHLAGAGVAEEKWTEKRKNVILESRTKSTELLLDKIKSTPNKLKGFISATAIGIYGETGNSLVDENAKPGDDFLAKVCVEWEKEVDKIAATGLRTAKIRIGVVLAPEGGALSQIAKPIQYFVGAPLGNGEQYMSWIHIDDLCQLFLKTIKDETMEGAFNAVAPNPVTMEQMVAAIARTINRPVFPINVPVFVLKGIMGEMSGIVLASTRVSSKKTEGTGFEFQFPHLLPALKNLFRK